MGICTILFIGGVLGSHPLFGIIYSGLEVKLSQSYYCPQSFSQKKTTLDHQGPVSTYMASCNGDCSTFAANDALWFKIDADGYDSTTRQWAAAKLISSMSMDGFSISNQLLSSAINPLDNSSWTSKIPPGLAPGQYVRLR